MNKTSRYNVIFRPEPEGGFTVIVPSLPGCVSYGRNLREAKKMAVDAIKGYVASLKKHKDYTRLRKKLFGEETLNTFYKKIKQIEKNK